MNSLSVIRVVVPPGAIHSARIDVVRNHIAGVGELLVAARTCPAEGRFSGSSASASPRWIGVRDIRVDDSDRREQDGAMPQKRRKFLEHGVESSGVEIGL